MLARHPRREREHALTAEAVREVGILLATFAPLDSVFAASTTAGLGFGLSFFLLGLLLFRIGLRLEDVS